MCKAVLFQTNIKALVVFLGMILDWERNGANVIITSGKWGEIT